MDERQVQHAMNIDDAYVVERRLAHSRRGTTELVMLDGAGPFVRKRIPLAEAHRVVWAALAECSCALLPRVRATYEMPDEFVAVCDYVPGETVAERMERTGRLPLAEVAGIMADLCAAVGELHAHGIIHADIAPTNIVLAEDGAHLIDFGSTRMVFDAPRAEERAWGTHGFAAPEQHGFAPLDTRADLYALGRLADYLLTGTHLDERTYEAALRCSGQVPEAVCRVLGRACAFEPSARYQTAEELGQAFAAAVRDEVEDAAAPASAGPPLVPAADELAPGTSTSSDEERVSSVSVGPSVADLVHHGSGRRRRILAIAAVIAVLAVGVLVALGASGMFAPATSEVGGAASSGTASSVRDDAEDHDAGRTKDLANSLGDAATSVSIEFLAWRACSPWRSPCWSGRRHRRV